MAYNRLKLDFSIEFIDDRIDFVQNYVNQEQFSISPLTDSELETISNYVLWGKHREDGKNSVQRKEFEIDTKSKLWQSSEKTESLDALIESPTFDENTIVQPGEVSTKIPRTVFSRDEARRNVHSSLLPELEDLFRTIDETDLIINFYDLAHNKRKNPPRDELLARFSEEEQLQFKTKAESISQYHYLKLRHLLVELRQQQYHYKDSYSNSILHNPTICGAPQNPKDYEPLLDVDIDVYPLGVRTPGHISEKLFQPLAQVIPANFSEKELQQLSKLIWSHNNRPNKNYFDFFNVEHIYNVLINFSNLEDAADRDTLNRTTQGFLDTLEYYISIAELSEVQREILDFKIKGIQNAQIAAVVNSKYGKSYTVNYISTIYRQKILPLIVEAAQYHLRVCENLFFPEEFKECNTCGQLMLRDSYNFVRKSRAKDGFTNRCKRCDKTDRERKKS